MCTYCLAFTKQDATLGHSYICFSLTGTVLVLYSGLNSLCQDTFHVVEVEIGRQKSKIFLHYKYSTNKRCLVIAFSLPLFGDSI